MHKSRSANRKRRLILFQNSNSAEPRGLIHAPQPVWQDPTHSIDEFYTACGGTQPLHVKIDDQNAGGEPTYATTHRPYVLIGRGKGCHIRLRHPDVSFRHAYFQLNDRQIHVFDLASRTGMIWRTRALNSGVINFGEAVQIGPYTIQLYADDFEDEFAESDSAADAIDRKAEFSEVTLNFLNAKAELRTWRLNQNVALIGQHQSCRVNLADDSVSRVHCSLVRTRWGIWVVDLMGRGGTFVNGKSVECARLEDGCELGVGKFRIQLTFGAESAQRSHTERFPATSESVPATKATTLGEPAQKEPIRLAVRSDRETPQGLTRTADSGPPSDSFPTPGVEFPNLDRQSTDSFSEPFVISLIKEFAAMQQQMFVQSQQAMMTMAQMLTTVHQDQMALFRDELAQVRSLNRELQQLRLQLKQTQPESAADSPSTADLDRVERLLLDHTNHVDNNGSEPVDARSFREGETPAETQRNVAREEPVDVSPASGTAETTDAAEPDEVADSLESPSAADDAEDLASSQSKTDGYEAHAWLCQRMAVIEKERNSRWKKILKALRGGSKDRSHHDALVDGGVDDSVT